MGPNVRLGHKLLFEWGISKASTVICVSLKGIVCIADLLASESLLKKQEESAVTVIGYVDIIILMQ